MRQIGLMERLFDRADLFGEPLPRQPLVELFGERRVLIECHGGVTAYSDTQILVKVRFGQIRVQGRCLRVDRMTREQMVITGSIDSVELLRGGCR